VRHDFVLQSMNTVFCLKCAVTEYTKVIIFMANLRIELYVDLCETDRQAVDWTVHAQGRIQFNTLVLDVLSFRVRT
jgi:hypothetical protein